MELAGLRACSQSDLRAAYVQTAPDDARHFAALGSTAAAAPGTGPLQHGSMLEPDAARPRTRLWIGFVPWAALVACIILGAISMRIRPAPRIPAWKWRLENYDSDQLLGKLFLFYEAQESGALRNGSRVPWRGDAYMHDGAGAGLNLTGGWSDAGDHLKLIFPLCWTLTQIAWALLDGGEVLQQGHFQGVSNAEWALQTLCRGLDFLLRCHPRNDTLVVQVGEAHEDHSRCLRAQLDDITPRTVFMVNSSHPGADALAVASAAFAAVGLALRQHSGYADLAAESLRHAAGAYAAANSSAGSYSAALLECAKTYNTTGNTWQQFAYFAAAWQYRATTETVYLKDAMRWRVQSAKQKWHADNSWSATYHAASALLIHTQSENGDDDDRLAGDADLFAASHLEVLHGIQRTPLGLSFVSEWGSCRHAAGIAALLAMRARHLADTQPARAQQLLVFAEKQICYSLGATGRSFVTGFGPNAPHDVHHRDAALTLEQSGNWTIFNDARIPSANSIVGGLVGGPDLHDGYEDVRVDYRHNEVALDYNAALIVGTVQSLMAARALAAHANVTAR